MRKKIFATMIVAVVAAFAGYNVYQSQYTNTLSDLALANVEALAEDEGLIEDWWNSKVYSCQTIKVWEYRWIQYKDVPRDDAYWEVSTSYIDPETWGMCWILIDDTECVGGNSTAHCWDC